jgi:hypothetical protein
MYITKFLLALPVALRSSYAKRKKGGGSSFLSSAIWTTSAMRTSKNLIIGKCVKQILGGAWMAARGGTFLLFVYITLSFVLILVKCMKFKCTFVYASLRNLIWSFPTVPPFLVVCSRYALLDCYSFNSGAGASLKVLSVTHNSLLLCGTTAFQLFPILQFVIPLI